MNGKSKLKKKIVSIALVLAMLVTMVPVAAFAQGDGTSDKPIVVYRNPAKDPAGSSMFSYGSFNVRDTTIDEWKSEIVSTQGIDVNDVEDFKYYVSTFNNYVSFEKNNFIVPWVYWFGWNTAKTGEGRLPEETEKVQLIDSSGNVMTDVEHVFVSVKNHVTVTWIVGADETTSAIELSDDSSLSNVAPSTYIPGKTFIGWDTNQDGDLNGEVDLTPEEAAVYFAKIIDVTSANDCIAAKTIDGKTFTAVYEDLEYTVTWKNYNGNVLETDENVKYDSTPSYNSATPTKPSTAQYTYTFAGWTPEVEAVTGDVTYTATYTEVLNKYKVTWLNDDEITQLAESSVEYGTIPAYPKSENPTSSKGGSYAFAGWFDEEGEPISAVTGNKSYIAKYSEIDNSWTVTFQANGGHFGDSEDLTQRTINVTKGTPVSEPEQPLLSGYRFDGWYVTNEDGSSSKYDFSNNVTADLTLVAKWIKVHTVTFDPNGGTLTGEESIEVDEGQTINQPEANYQGYKLDGWYVANEDGSFSRYEFNNSVTTDLTLIAKWTKIHTVTLNSNGGTLIGEESISVEDGQVIQEPKVNSDGYKFDGWFIEDENGTLTLYDFNTQVKSDIELIAKWSRYPATIEAENVEVAYVSNEKTLKENIITTILENAKVISDGETIANAEITVNEEDLTRICAGGVGTYENVTLNYAGTGMARNTTTTSKYYDSAEKDITVSITPGIAEVVVKSNTVKYKHNLTKDNIFQITSGVDTINMIVGMDIHNEEKLDGIVQVELPEDLYMALDFVAAFNDIKIDDISIEQLEELVKAAEGIENNTTSAAIAAIKQYKEEIKTLIGALKKVQAELAEVNVNTELKISIVSELTLPENIGLYLVASILADDNYVAKASDESNANMDAGYLIITPNGIKADLTWNATDDNDIYTLNKIANGFDFGATAEVDGTTLDGVSPNEYNSKGAQKHVEYMFVGVDKNGLVIDRCTEPDAAAKALAVGGYAQVAYVANWDNIMYYSVPIVRPVVVAPNPVDVNIIDVNKAENYAQAYTYGDDIKLAVTVDGEVATDETGESTNENLTVQYIGSDTTVDGWYRETFPTDAGVYTVVATYTEDKDGTLNKAGGAVGVLIINPADAEIGLEDASYEYDGNEHFATITNKSFDYATVAIDRVNNIAYVNLPADTKAHIERIIAMLPADAEAAVNEQLSKYADFDGDVQMSALKEEMNDMLQKVIAVDMVTAAEAEADALLDKLIEKFENSEEVKALVEDVKDDLAALKAKIGESIPDSIEAEIARIIENAVKVDEEGNVDIDTESLKADLNTMLNQLKSELPASVVAELEETIKEIITAIEGNADVQDAIEEIESELTKVYDEVAGLTKKDIAKLALKVAYEAYGEVDKDKLKDLAAEVIYKIEAQGYIDYAEGMIENIKGMYGGNIDTDDLEEAIKKLVTDSKAAIEAGNIDEESFETLETYIEDILKEMQNVINQLPDGKIIFGENPKEVGEYDCYAINISANYKAEFVEADLIIYEKEVPPTDPTEPTEPTGPTEPEDKPDAEEPVDDETDTGDHSNLAFPLLLATAALTAMVALLGARRRRS